MEHPDKPLPSLDLLQQKIDAAKAHSGMETRDTSAVDGEAGIGKAMRMGMELVAGVAVGSTAGFFMDRWLGTMPFFFILFFFIGAAAGFRNMVRETKKDDDRM